MRGGGRGGGGGGGGGGGRGQQQQQQARGGAAAGDGAEIPQASRKLVQGLKGILADRTEAEIYATLLDCAMDPDVAVERSALRTTSSPSSCTSSSTGRQGSYCRICPGRATPLNVLAGQLAASPSLHLSGFFYVNGQPMSQGGYKGRKRIYIASAAYIYTREWPVIASTT